MEQVPTVSFESFDHFTIRLSYVQITNKLHIVFAILGCNLSDNSLDDAELVFL
jgi:hypothetical protein